MLTIISKPVFFVTFEKNDIVAFFKSKGLSVEKISSHSRTATGPACIVVRLDKALPAEVQAEIEEWPSVDYIYTSRVLETEPEDLNRYMEINLTLDIAQQPW